MINKEETVAIFPTMKMTFYLCPTIYFLAGSYDQTTIRGAAWQVSSQGANADKCTGNQLQLANVAIKVTHMKKELIVVDMKLNLQGWQKTHELYRKNVGPSCNTWHQAATMYLPSTPYTGECMKMKLWTVS